MTTPPVKRIEELNDHARIEHYTGGASEYVLTTRGVEERFTRVTSPLEPVAKGGLVPWAGWEAANAAFEHLPRLVASALVPVCGQTYNQCEHDWRERCTECPCRDCQPCLVKFLADQHIYKTARRSDEGTRFHILASSWINTGTILPHEPDLAPYVATFQRFIEELDLTPKSFEWSEALVVNRMYRYAGQCDAGLWLVRGTSRPVDDLLDRLTLDGQPRRDKALLMGDWKSREAEGRQPFQDMALQLTGYRFAEKLRLRDGTEVPMPQVDATAVFQIRPDGYSVILTRSRQEEFVGFLGYLQGHRWQIEHGAASVSSLTFKFAPSVARARARDAARRRAADKKAAQSTSGPSTVDAPESSPGKSKMDDSRPSTLDAGAREPFIDREIPESTRASILGAPSDTLQVDPYPF